MRTIDWLDKAVVNNADWCECVARSHGIKCARDAGTWMCSQKMPPLYPNLVTLDSGESQLEKIQHLDKQLPKGWSVKDSYGCLDLQPLGFKNIIESAWYLREPGIAWPTLAESPMPVQRVSSSKDLGRWVDAWGETPDGDRIFVAEILENAAVQHLFVEEDQEITAGLAVNMGASVVGISNIFGSSQGINSCILSVCENNQDLGVVGYGSSSETKFLRRFAFRTIGHLRIWLRE
jgi:hypothetical protein